MCPGTTALWIGPTRFIVAYLVIRVELLLFLGTSKLLLISIPFNIIFRSDDPTERVWGVAYEISQDFWDRVLEPKVGYRERGGYNTDEVEFHQFDAAATTVKDKIMVTLFLGDKSSPNYKPGTIDELAQQIVRAIGASGTNLEYLYQTAEGVRYFFSS